MTIKRFQRKINNIPRKVKKKGKLKFYFRMFVFLFVFFYFVNPLFFKRLVFPKIYGVDYLYQDISEKEYFEDVNFGGFIFERNGKKYKLIPKVKYSVTGRIGIVEHYDTLFGKFFRGYFQGDYINLAPRDALILTGNMAKEDIFKKFYFKHEERGGYVLCKGVKYKTSFASAYKSEEEFLKSKENYEKCQPFLKVDEYNNYHLIPVNDQINKALSMLRYGDIISLDGFLVDVPEMKLSTGTRKGQNHKDLITNGMNPGKCFILYTNKVVINNIVYE